MNCNFLYVSRKDFSDFSVSCEAYCGEREEGLTNFCFISFSDYLRQRHNIQDIRERNAVVKTVKIKTVGAKFIGNNYLKGGRY